MRLCRALLLLALSVLPATALRAQNVEVHGWRPSDWRLVPDAQASAEAGAVSGSAAATPRWVRWGTTDKVAAIARANGTIALRASADAVPENCALPTGNSSYARAFSAECVAAMALSRSRQSQLRAGIEWVGGPVSLSASLGISNTLAPLTESLNPLGSLPVWLLDEGLRADPALAGSAAEVRSRDLAVRGDWRVNSSVSVQFHGSRGELATNVPASSTSRVEAEQTVLGFGITRGSLRGTVTGQRLVPKSPLRNGEEVTALDLGVSWRTPWQGELTVGARELSRPNTPLHDPAAAAKVREERTPYVQYRQDL